MCVWLRRLLVLPTHLQIASIPRLSTVVTLRLMLRHNPRLPVLKRALVPVGRRLPAVVPHGPVASRQVHADGGAVLLEVRGGEGLEVAAGDAAVVPGGRDGVGGGVVKLEAGGGGGEEVARGTGDGLAEGHGGHAGVMRVGRGGGAGGGGEGDLGGHKNGVKKGTQKAHTAMLALRARTAAAPLADAVAAAKSPTPCPIACAV